MIPDKGLLNFSGLYGESIGAIVPEFIHYETLATRSRAYNWEITEHLHQELYQLFMIMEGNGTLISEKRQFYLKAPCLITIPANTLHGFFFDPEINGLVLTLSESYLDTILKSHLDIHYQMAKLRVYQLEGQLQQTGDLNSLKNKIISELSEVDSERIALLPILQLLFITIYRLGHAENIKKVASSNPSLRIFREFQKLVRKTLNDRRSVNGYAEELGITPVHLNRVCQNIAQQSALKLIHQRVVDEAKRYLLNTEYSVSEVGYLLNFHDPAHFTKLFKKYVGVSPSEFRKN